MSSNRAMVHWPGFLLRNSPHNGRLRAARQREFLPGFGGAALAPVRLLRNSPHTGRLRATLAECSFAVWRRGTARFALLIPGFLVAGCAFGQIGFPGQFPGQYPGGQYPGQGRYPGGSSSPYPGRGRTSTQDKQASVTTFNGMLRRVDGGDIVVQSDDKRIVTISFSNATRYYKASGGSGRLKDFDPGDHVSVDATQDDNGYYHATKVNQIRVGTPEERAAAMEPVDTSPTASAGNSGGNSGGSSGNSGGDDDRPRLRRAASADDTSKPQSSSSGSSRADSSSSRADSQSTSTAAPTSSDPNDSGPPVLRRGTTRRAASSDTPAQIADSSPAPGPRPSIHADDVNGVTRAPEAPKLDTNRIDTNEPVAGARLSTPKSGDPVIDKAREEAFSFSETLPNYVVKQFTTRYATGAARGGQTSWRALDSVTADVVSEGGKESYKNILVDGKPPREAVEKSGSWSTGEYASVLLDILQPATDADFHNKRSTTIVNRVAFRYDFSVEQPNSHWHVYTGGESYLPEYTGAIWIDKENFRVLRIELSARNMPRGFPLDTVESAVDYDYVMIGGNKFLLPVHSEALSCERGTSLCSRNVIDFRNYKKFGADTSITFEPTP